MIINFRWEVRPRWLNSWMVFMFQCPELDDQARMYQIVSVTVLYKYMYACNIIDVSYLIIILKSSFSISPPLHSKPQTY